MIIKVVQVDMGGLEKMEGSKVGLDMDLLCFFSRDRPYLIGHLFIPLFFLFLFLFLLMNRVDTRLRSCEILLMTPNMVPTPLLQKDVLCLDHCTSGSTDKARVAIDPRHNMLMSVEQGGVIR